MTNLHPKQFLDRLTASQLLDAQQLQRVLSLLQQEPHLTRAAIQLVEWDYLTRWQARVLLSGDRTRFFLGKYKLLKLIGEGAMGSVFKAVHPIMNRTVALKVMCRDILHDRRAIARFQQEIRAVAALDHPHIVRALDADYAHRNHFLVMEYVEGKDLRHWIKSAGQLPIAWSCECVRQAAEALQHAHDRGIVHRDLKPSNLIVAGKKIGPKPLVKLADFGLARMTDEIDLNLTRTGRTVGTMAFMAPEQVHNSHTDIRADIYSLGCVLFQAIAGRLPFQANSELESLKLRLEHDAPPLSEFRQEVPPSLDELVARMLARDPAKRFATPALLADSLRGCLHDLAARTPEPEPGTAPKSEVPTNAGTLDVTDASFDLFLESLAASENHEQPLAQHFNIHRWWSAGYAAGAGWLLRLIGSRGRRRRG